MAEFKSWAENGPVREPTATEFDVGFACGLSPRDLFNWLFRQIARDKAYMRSLGFYRSAIAQQNDPPNTPAAGDTYVVGDTPTGDWAGQANNIAEYSGESWNFIVPIAWMLVGLSNKTDIRWDHVGGAWTTVAVHAFATEPQHLAGTSTALLTHPSGVQAMIDQAIGGLPPDQVLGLATNQETITGTNTTKATHAAGVTAAILHYLGALSQVIRSFQHDGDTDEPTSGEWASPVDGVKAIVSDTTGDTFAIYDRQDDNWVLLGTSGGGGTGQVAGYWHGNPYSGSKTAGTTGIDWAWYSGGLATFTNNLGRTLNIVATTQAGTNMDNGGASYNTGITNGSNFSIDVTNEDMVIIFYEF